MAFLSSHPQMRTIQIIHFAMITGMVMFLGVIGFLHSSGSFDGASDDSLNQVLFMVSAAALITLIPISYLIYRNRLKAIPKSIGLEEKLEAYKTTNILQFALLDAAAMVSLVTFLLTEEKMMIIPIGIILGIFFLNRPSVSKTVQELELSSDEGRSLQ